MNLAKLMYIVGFLDLFGVSIVVPLINKHAISLGTSPTLAGILGSLYGGLQLFSSPIVGKWSDLSGRRHVLMWCLALSAVSYSLLGLSTTIVVLFLARIPAGLFKHSQGIARACLTDNIPKAEQANVLGRFNAASSIGFIVGPIVGGHVADLDGGFYYAAFLAATVFILNDVLVLFSVPQEAAAELSKKDKQKNKQEQLKFSPFAFLESFTKTDWRQQWDLFVVRFLMGLAVLVYRSNFLILLNTKYNTSSKTSGYIMSYNGVVSTISGLLVGKISNFYSDDNKLMFHTAIAQTLAIAVLAAAPNLWIFAFTIAPLSLVNAVARVVTTKLTVSRGKGEDVGALLGLGASVVSVSRMLSPTIGGLSQEVSVSGPPVVGAMCAGATVIFMLIFPPKSEDQKVKDKAG